MSASCPQCGGHSTFFAASTDRNRHTTDEVFDYYQCAGCGLVFMDPIPADLRPFYAGGYHSIPASIEAMDEVAAPDRYRLEPVLAYRQSGKLLEIGPWMGMFSYNAQQAGFDVTAIEMDQGCVDFMNETLGIRAIQSTDPAATLVQMEETFDVIALWHSLEHLHRPWEVIRVAAEHLSPEGILLISIPNIESYEFSLLGAAWRNLDAPRHLYFFPKRSLVAQCERVGLKLVSYTTGDAFSRHFHHETWFLVSRELIPIKYIRGMIRALVKWFIWRHERRHESGPGMTAVFQRPAEGSAVIRTSTEMPAKPFSGPTDRG